MIRGEGGERSNSLSSPSDGKEGRDGPKGERRLALSMCDRRIRSDQMRRRSWGRKGLRGRRATKTDQGQTTIRDGVMKVRIEKSIKRACRR